jgi:hypothetical protein
MNFFHFLNLIYNYYDIEEFNKVVLRDAKKTQYCLYNNIKLIRILKISDIEEKLRFLWEQNQQ